MKLEQYIQGLQDLIEENPEAKDFTVVTSIDDEGNGFSEIYWGPSLGEYDGEDFMQDNAEDDPVEVNAVCVN